MANMPTCTSAVDFAAQFIHALGGARLEMLRWRMACRTTARSWFSSISCIASSSTTCACPGQASLLAHLNTQVENLYSNNYLLKLNNNWQAFVDAAPKVGCLSGRAAE
jgi:hypothetical protein